MRLVPLLALLAAFSAAAQVPEPRREQPPEQPPTMTPPKLLGEMPAAAYPPGASGDARVMVQIEVDESGAPTNLVVTSPAQLPFDEAALAAARTLRFEPARLGSKPIPVRIQIAFNFQAPRTRGAAADKPVNLFGVVRERGTRKKLSGVEVAAGEASAATDGEGRFELRGVPEGAPVEIVVSAPGYLRFTTRETVEPGKRLEVEYRIQPIISGALELTIEGERERRELSRTTIPILEAERIPGAQGDALKIIEDLPGVARTSPIGGGFLVIRGSKPGDSFVYLDGEPIPLLFHFGAISSVVNPDLLEAIDFIPGNFSSAYGDLTGGLVEVRTRDLRSEPHGYANLNLLEASALVEGELAPGLHAAVAARRSYIDAILKATVANSPDFALTVAPFYYDAELRLDYRPRLSPHRLSLFAIASDDELGVLLNRPTDQDPNLSGSIDAKTAFQQIRLKHEYARGPFTLETIGMFERLELRFNVGPSNFLLLGHDFFLRSTARYQAGDVSFASGLDLANRRVIVGATFRQSFLFREGEFNNQGPRPDDAVTTVPPSIYFRFSPGLWGEARWKLFPNLILTAGLRGDVFTYAPRDSHTTWTLTPRLTARWDLSDSFALKAGLGLYSQGARNGDAARPFGNPQVLPERAFQGTLGAEARPLPGVFASVEAFYKGLSDLIVRTDAVENGQPVILDNAGTGRVYGLEVLVRKELTERLFGWVAYTLSRSDRVDRPGEPRRLFDFDQTHNLTVIASYKLPAGWQIGGRLRIISGNPDTPVLGARYLAGFDAYLPIYGLANSTRVPTFRQLDVRVDKTWTFDSWLLDVYLDVLNATNRRSIEGSVYSYDFSQHDYFKGLPVIPTLGLKGSF